VAEEGEDVRSGSFKRGPRVEKTSQVAERTVWREEEKGEELGRISRVAKKKCLEPRNRKKRESKKFTARGSVQGPPECEQKGPGPPFWRTKLTNLEETAKSHSAVSHIEGKNGSMKTREYDREGKEEKGAFPDRKANFN